MDQVGSEVCKWNKGQMKTNEEGVHLYINSCWLADPVISLLEGRTTLRRADFCMRAAPRVDEAVTVVIPLQLCMKAKHPPHSPPCLGESRSTNREVGIIATSQLRDKYPKISLVFQAAKGPT
jgi:hypothetical protein